MQKLFSDYIDFSLLVIFTLVLTSLLALLFAMVTGQYNEGFLLYVSALVTVLATFGGVFGGLYLEEKRQDTRKEKGDSRKRVFKLLRLNNELVFNKSVATHIISKEDEYLKKVGKIPMVDYQTEAIKSYYFEDFGQGDKLDSQLYTHLNDLLVTNNFLSVVRRTPTTQGDLLSHKENIIENSKILKIEIEKIEDILSN